MLPKGWKKQAVEDCADLLTGNAFRSEDYVEAGESTVRLLRGDNIIQGSLRWDDAKHWATPYAEALQRYEMRAGDIVLAMDRSIVNAGLKCSVIRQQDLPSLLVQRVARLRAKKNFDQGYLAHVLQTHRFIEHLRGQKTETAVPHISPNDIREFEFPCPINPDEQRRIAQILSTWDQAIATAERLLENSEHQKRALIGDLMHGKKRRSGFNEKWGNSQLQNVCTLHKGSTLSKADIRHDGENSCILYGELFTIYAEVISRVRSRTSSDQGFLAKKGDVLMPTATTTVAKDLARASVLMVEDVLVGGDSIIIRPREEVILGEFLAYLITYVQQGEIAAKAQGATIVHISAGDLADIKLCFPSIDEQEAICDVLRKANTEICLLKRNVERLKTEKIALMSQLLTGKRRVMLPDAEAEVQA